MWLLGLRGRESCAAATVPAGYCSREGEREERLALGEVSNLIVASCLIITDTRFFFYRDD